MLPGRMERPYAENNLLHVVGRQFGGPVVFVVVYSISMLFRRFFFLLALGVAPLHATTEAIPNFAMLDHEGRFHEFDYLCRTPGTKGILIFVHGNGCPLVRKRIPELKRLRGGYEKRGIRMIFLNANLQDTRDGIREEAKTFEMDFPILIDEAQVMARKLGLTRTAEALLVDAKTKKIVYRGSIDDRLHYQKEKPKASEHYLIPALDAFLKGEVPTTPQTEAPGCKISLEKPRSELSYAEHIAPILKKRCVTCHTKGGIGPFPMSSYKKVKGWSEMMEEVIITRQMPPWHADPNVGKFAEDQGLTAEEKATLLAWIASGAPRGEGEDPLVGYKPESVEWRLGTPDHVIDLPLQKVPAEGVHPYRYVRMETPFDSDVWLRGMEVNPGNENVLHHVVVTGKKKGSRQRGDGKFFTGYAPGTAAWPAPDGMGVKLPRGYELKFQLHYTSSGKEETDETKIGFFLAKGEVKKEVFTKVIINPRFEIRPHVNDYGIEYKRAIDKDIMLYAMNPHMHYRGKRMSFHAQMPDGEQRDLLSVPNYNFNWQRTYVLEEPMKLSKGTKMIVRNAWDNSAQNPHNPDPSKKVRWGDQSFEEMFFATYQYTEE